MQLDSKVQLQVIQDFSPKANTQDVNRLFHGFIKSVSQRAAGLPTSHASARQQAVNAGADISLSIATQGYKRATLGGDAPSEDDIAHFLQVWGLDNSCAMALEAQSPEVQRRVLLEFQPKAGTRDPRSLFHGFLKSVAMGGGKRARAETYPAFMQ